MTTNQFALSEESESTCEGDTCRKVLPSSMLNNGLCWDCGNVDKLDIEDLEFESIFNHK